MNDILTNLIKENEKLIYSIINKYSYYFNIDDLYQVSVIGLINAYKNYNQDKNTKFSTYAYFYILGEVKNYIRESNYFKVSKDLVKLNTLIDKTSSYLEQKLLRTPTLEEISIYLKMDYSLLEEAQSISNLVKSLDDEDDSMYNYIGYEDNSLNSDVLDLKHEIDCLSDFEKSLIINRYEKGYTQKETSDIMNINQTKVCRTEKEILAKLRVRLRC